MSVKKEEEIILKLLLKGQSEADIIEHLRKRDMVDQVTIYTLKNKIREMKAAQAFLPHTPSFLQRLSCVIFGLIITLLGFFFLFTGSAIYGGKGLIACGIVVAGGLSLIKKGIVRMRWD